MKLLAAALRIRQRCTSPGYMVTFGFSTPLTVYRTRVRGKKDSSGVFGSGFGGSSS